MIQKKQYYVLAAFWVGMLIACLLSRPDLNAFTTVVVNLRKSVKAAASDTNQDAEEPPSFGDFTGKAQDDPGLINFIRDQVVKRPSEGPYKLENPQRKDFSEFNQSTLADKLIFKGKKKGFFVEVGAVDGEYLSESLYFEREHGWTGLLIEPNFDTFEKIYEKGRRAYSINGALSPVKSPMDLLYNHWGVKGRDSKASVMSEGMHVDAYPLYSLLFAVNGLDVDFLSLDARGMEMKVLRTLPWKKVKFHVMCICKGGVSLGELVAYLAEQGYKHIGIHKEDAWFVDYDIFNKTVNLKI